MIVFVQRFEFSAFAQLDPARFRVLNQGRNHATAFDITGVRIKEAVFESIFGECRKALVKCEFVKAFEAMSVFFQKTAAFVFKIARLHSSFANEQNAGFVIELNSELRVPFFPNRDAALGQFGINLVRAVGGADRLADIGRSS